VPRPWQDSPDPQVGELRAPVWPRRRISKRGDRDYVGRGSERPRTSGWGLKPPVDFLGPPA